MENKAQEFYRTIEQKISVWAAEEEDIRAAMVVGSRARAERPGDEWSDLDVILFCRAPEAYLDRTDWIEAFAPVWVSVVQRTVAGEPERLVVFDGGWQCDFVFDDAAQLERAPEMLASENIPDSVRRGTRLLVDKDGWLAGLPPPSPVPPPPPPSQEAFTALVERFWFEVVFASKQLRRGELTFYKRSEEGLRWRVLEMMAWHAQAMRGADTWHAGRFLASWAEPEAYAAFARSYTPLEREACWGSLRTLADLFTRLARDTAATIGLDDLAQRVQPVRDYLANLRA